MQQNKKEAFPGQKICRKRLRLPRAEKSRGPGAGFKNQWESDWNVEHSVLI